MRLESDIEVLDTTELSGVVGGASSRFMAVFDPWTLARENGHGKPAPATLPGVELPILWLMPIGAKPQSRKTVPLRK